MRQERTAINGDGESVGYTFFFQIADDGGRRACCVKVDAENVHEALPPASARLIKLMNKISEEHHESLYAILRELLRMIHKADELEPQP